MRGFLATRAPNLARVLGRRVAASDLAFVVVAIAIASVLLVKLPDLGPGALHHAKTWGALLTWTLETAATAGGLAVFLALPFPRGDGAGTTALASAIVLSLATLDHAHHTLFGTHVDRARVDVTVDAVRTGALEVPRVETFIAITTFLGLWTVLFVALKLLARARRPAGLEGEAGWGARAIVLGAGALVILLAAGLNHTEAAASSSAVTDPFAREHTIERLVAANASLDAGAVSAGARPDILFIHIESLRFDVMRAEVMPTLTRFAGESLTVPHHYSTGNGTGAGMFGLLTGLPASIFPQVRAAGLAPLPLRVLRALGYTLAASFTNDGRVYHGLYEALFHGTSNTTYPKPENASGDVADADMVERYLAATATPNHPPRFDYLIFDATHYPYPHPASFQHEMPEWSIPIGIIFLDDKVRARGPFMRNKYENSATYVDSLLARVIARLRESNALEHTIVVVTGDHGEEFWERRAYGHNVALDEYETRVPFVLYLPPSLRGDARIAYTYGSHSDVFPTIFDAMHVTLGDVRFMTGKSLLRFDPSLDVALMGFGDDAPRNDHVSIVGAGMRVEVDETSPLKIASLLTESDDPIPLGDGSIAAELARRGLALETLRTPDPRTPRAAPTP